MQRDVTYLLDILQAARLFQSYSSDGNKANFEQDVMRQDAIIRRIEIIGEAVRRISQDFPASYPAIPWTDMAGMRSRLIHNYDEVDLDLVWDVIERDIPALIAQITPLVPPDEERTDR